MALTRYLFILFFGIQHASSAMDISEHESLPILTESMAVHEWLNFARIGGCYYPIPEKLKQYIPQMLALACEVPASKTKASYHCDDKHQIEFLYAEQNEWAKYPEEIQIIAMGMRDIAVTVLLNLLRALEIDENLYSKTTGGLSNTNGKHFLKIAHYDATKPCPGLSWHKDIRWITVLFINQEGLEGKIGNNIVQVPPLDGYFFINIGVFFEAFINNTNILNAFVHQVRQVYKERVSFGVFVEGNYPEKGFYQKSNDEIIWKPAEDLRAFLIEDKQHLFSSSPHIVFDR